MEVKHKADGSPHCCDTKRPGVKSKQISHVMVKPTHKEAHDDFFSLSLTPLEPSMHRNSSLTAWTLLFIYLKKMHSFYVCTCF